MVSNILSIATAKQKKPRFDDDFVDRLNSRVTVAILVRSPPIICTD